MAKTICVDAGHGGKDPGAVNGKYCESKAAISIALKLGSLLEKNGYKVVYTRKNDAYKTLGERCRISNATNADAFVSVHLNAATNKNAEGLETYRYANCGTTTKRLAESIHNNLIESTGAKNRGVKTASFYVLKHTKAPAVLIECGFISNDKECKKLFTTEYQSNIAASVYNGIASVVK